MRAWLTAAAQLKNESVNFQLVIKDLCAMRFFLLVRPSN